MKWVTRSRLVLERMAVGEWTSQESEDSHSFVLMTDNSSVVAYLDKQGGTISQSQCQLTLRDPCTTGASCSGHPLPSMFQEDKTLRGSV